MNVLPAGFHRIRYYGFLTSQTRARNIARIRELLAVPLIPIDAIKAANAKPEEPKAPEHPCPCCGGRMRIIETFLRGQQVCRSSMRALVHCIIATLRAAPVGRRLPRPQPLPRAFALISPACYQVSGSRFMASSLSAPSWFRVWIRASQPASSLSHVALSWGLMAAAAMRRHSSALARYSSDLATHHSMSP
jgi:hypothetical protein